MPDTSHWPSVERGTSDRLCPPFVVCRISRFTVMLTQRIPFSTFDDVGRLPCLHRRAYILDAGYDKLACFVSSLLVSSVSNDGSTAANSNDPSTLGFKSNALRAIVSTLSEKIVCLRSGFGLPRHYCHVTARSLLIDFIRIQRQCRHCLLFS